MDHDNGTPGVEDRVCDDGAERRSADHIVAVQHGAEDAVIVVVGNSAVVNRLYMTRDSHVAAEVVVIRVHEGVVVHLGVATRATSGISLRSGLRLGHTLPVVTSS